MIAYEGFDYGVGVDLSAQTVPAQFTGTYQSERSPGYTTVSGSLAYTNGSVLATTGNAMTGGNLYQTTGLGVNFSNSAWDSYKTTVQDQFSNNFNMIGQGTMYVSFLLQSTTGASIFGLYTGDNNAPPDSQLAIGTTVKVTDGGAVSLNLKSYDPGVISYDRVATDSTSGSGTTIQTAASTTSVTGGTINLYVLKLEFGTTDKVSLFVNPTVGGTEPGVVSTALTTPTGENLIFRSIP